MTLMTTTITMLAFAAVYAAVLTMLGQKASLLLAALTRQQQPGQPVKIVTAAASRAFSRA